MLVLDKIMELLEATNYTQLAQKLGVSSAATISNWKSRRVPEQVLRDLEIKYGKPRGFFEKEMKDEKSPSRNFMDELIASLPKEEQEATVEILIGVVLERKQHLLNRKE